MRTFAVADRGEHENADGQEVPQILALSLQSPVLRLACVHAHVRKPDNARQNSEK
jgi:hypothetical protein